MYTLGIDIGSTTSKCAVIKDGKELVAHSLQTGGLGPGGRRRRWRRCGGPAARRRRDMARAFVVTGCRKNYEARTARSAS